MYNDIRKDIISCIICQICDKKESAKAKSSWPIHTNHLFERFGLDYVGPLTESSSGNQYIIVATEYYTKWPIAIPTKTADGSITARFLYSEIFCTFGSPLEILIDRGIYFRNNMIKEFCKLVQVNHKFSTPYHPQTNGAVENLNGVLINTLRKLTIKYPTHWDTWLPTALYAYRTKVHSTLKITPYELLYGVRPRNMDIIHFAEQVLGQQRLIAVDDQRDIAAQRVAIRQNEAWRPIITYKQGDIVLVMRMKVLKIQTKWLEKPYIIYRVHDNNTYDLIDEEGNFFSSRVHANRLKPLHI